MCRLRRAPVLVMIGNSGSGKSSLLRAGLIPALRAGRFQSERESSESWRVALFRPSAAPFDYLAEVLPSQLAPELSVTEQAEFISDCRSKLRSGDKDALRNAVSALVLAGSSATDRALATPVLLVVDQFRRDIYTDCEPAGPQALHWRASIRCPAERRRGPRAFGAGAEGRFLRALPGSCKA
jgi:energy-coupling factor transporter ATP-binding protein EcfA2